MKYLVIANPTSRRGKSAAQIPPIEKKLHEYAINFDNETLEKLREQLPD